MKSIYLRMPKFSSRSSRTQTGDNRTIAGHVLNEIHRSRGNHGWSNACFFLTVRFESLSCQQLGWLTPPVEHFELVYSESKLCSVPEQVRYQCIQNLSYTVDTNNLNSHKWLRSGQSKLFGSRRVFPWWKHAPMQLRTPQEYYLFPVW